MTEHEYIDVFNFSKLRDIQYILNDIVLDGKLNDDYELVRKLISDITNKVGVKIEVTD
jgi:hypothetical protein